MARKGYGNSQSPRAKRSSTDDALKHSKGKVQKRTGNFDHTDAAGALGDDRTLYSSHGEGRGDKAS
jgi:hypothetical protein